MGTPVATPSFASLPLSQASPGGPVAALPPLRGLSGPVTTRLLGRLLAIYALLLAAGAALLWQGPSDAWQVLGLGLMAPGAGFWAHANLCAAQGIGHLAMVLGGGAAFALSLALWFGTGNVLAPPLVWGGLAVWAALMPHGPIQPGLREALPLCLGGVAGVVALGALARWCWARRQRRLDNTYLAAQAPLLHQVFTAPPPQAQAEMSLAHLQRLRFALDRALQPVEAFDGFERRDQFQTAALRYQLNFLAYGLALTQARFTPAFGGYLHEAQHRLLRKQADHRSWAYWALENLWGNLRRDPDPVARENIMYTGFVALQMALLRASTGCAQVSQPGALSLRHPRGMVYEHHDASLLASLARATRRAPYHLVACEPNWVYPLCNMMGASARLAHDAQVGQAGWAGQAAAFRQHLEAEFLDAAGRYVPCRSSLTGLALPAVGGAMPLAMPCFFLNALAPDLARRQWLLLRRGLLDAQGRLRRRAFWPIDTGNYGWSRASAYTATALAAIELGDEAVAKQCLAALEDECPTVLQEGVMHRAQASVWAHGVELMALAGARGAFSQLLHQPLSGQGPRLEGVPYPAVLVAAAHADEGRGTLHAVLYAGQEEASVQAMVVSGLRPHGRYRVLGACQGRAGEPVQANALGQLHLQVLVTGRTVLGVSPHEEA